MALPNIDKLTSQLAMLPDMSLRQLAQMHKNDPYVLPLIISEDGRRKQMRAASQAQAGAQPQPRVADAAVQQIGQLPEEVGIGALSAPSMAGMPMGGITGEEAQAPQGMAGGGMVAFAHGGDVERYQFGGQPPASGGTEFAIPGMTQPLRSFMPQPGAPENTPFLRRQFEALMQRSDVQAAQRRAAVAQARIDKGIGTEADRDAVLTALALTSGAGQPAAPTTDVGVAGLAAENLSGMDRRLAASPQSLAASAPTAAAPTAAAPSAAAPEQRRTPPAAAATGARPAAAAAPTSLQDIMSQARGMADSRNDLRLLGIKDELTELSEAEKADAREATRLTRERQAKFADAYKGREERLTKREAEVEGSKEQNAGLALLQAGLAIMSTPGGLAQAVGKGGQAGLASYASGLERIKTSQEKLADARDRLDDAKLNREELSAKELNDALMAERKAATNARKVGIDFLMKQHNFDREDAKMYFESGARLAGTREEIASREKIAGMQERGATARANALPGEIRAAMLLGTGETEADKLRTGLPALMDLKDRLTDSKIAELYGKHVADAKKDMSTPLSPEDFAKAIKSATGAYRPKVADVEATRER